MSNQKMSVPEARSALKALRRKPMEQNEWEREVQIILDCVWLQAYEEGEAGIFGSEGEES